MGRFLFFHFEVNGWYLDFSKGFFPKEEEPLFEGLINAAPMEPVPMEEEPTEVQP